MSFRCIIMGAAGRDFHDFLRFFRDRPGFQVVCFTAEQIPYIDQRSFPRELAGPHYQADIPIHPEEELEQLIREHEIDFVFLAYSDLPHHEVMHRASIVQAAGASFALLGPVHTELVSKLPVIAVTASRTGAGKSPLCQALAHHLAGAGKRAGVIRHPMPYGDLRKQEVQRFAALADLDAHDCTVEEREEYAPYVEAGLVIFAGVDYARILEAAEKESDLILWDGGNNDASFIRAGLNITVVDALRAGHELGYYPGESNFRRADLLVFSKVNSASPEDLALLHANARAHNPSATVIESDLQVTLDDARAVRGKRVVVVDDGPTLTHGGMKSGAGMVAALAAGVGEVIDPRPHAVGSIAKAYADYGHLERALPALGYSDGQRAELAETIERAAPDLVIDGSPAGIERSLSLAMPVVRARYRFEQLSGPPIVDVVDQFLAGS
ncbi:MAG: GTPase [Deltaproteobacteria bacterium]|nr:GTPase [Deltaproteobacteria bacterium]